VTLQSPIEGQVAKIFVKLDDQVAAGTAIIQVDSAKQQVQLQKFKIFAPCAGTVGDILVNEGEYIKTSTQLATIIQNQPLEVNLSVPVNHAQKWRLGMPVELIDDQGGSVGTSQVFFISPKVDNRTQSVLIKSLLDNSKGQLRTGQFIRAKVIWDKRLGV
jgi:multidrug efflux pump subunit AcrA (membrane-fusion protein)